MIRIISFIVFFISNFWTFTQPDYTISINNNPHPGNLFFQVGGPPSKPVCIIDSVGSLIYNEDFGLKGWAWQVNMNNKISFFDRQSKGWFIMDSLENIVDTVYCQNNYVADNHDFLALENGNYVVFAYDERPYASDTIVANGSSNQNIIGLIIQELDANKNVLFEWSSFDHYFLSDYPCIYSNLGTSTLDFLHCNAIEIDEDGHFLISNRNISEITKIHRTTGQVIWRFGGDKSDFEMINDYPFSKQHCIKSLGNSRYLLYDNGNNSNIYTGGIKRSRAVEYELDFNNYTATKVWSFVHPDSLFTPSIGSVQRLDNGNTLICFGNNQGIDRGSVITEVNSNNEIVFELELDNGQNVYCANKASWDFHDETVQINENINTAIYNNYLYPNPSISHFYIEKITDDESIKRIEVYNLNGEVLLIKKVDAFELSNDLKINHTLVPGVYLIKVISENNYRINRLYVVD